MKKAGPEGVRLMTQFCCVVASVSRVTATPKETHFTEASQWYGQKLA